MLPEKGLENPTFQSVSHIFKEEKKIQKERGLKTPKKDKQSKSL